MEFSEFRLVMDEAKQWVEQQQKRTDCLPANIYNPKIKDFLVNTRNRVNKFALPHEESDERPGKIQKIPQPVPARWWYVGVAATFLKQFYWIVLRATHIIINLNDFKSHRNKIASGLQSNTSNDSKKRMRLPRTLASIANKSWSDTILYGKISFS
jgi:hypothetical protein